MKDFRNHPNIEMLDPATLKPAKGHARKRSKNQVDLLARGIDSFGFIVPIVVDENNIIGSGHGRREAAILRKMDLVPVIRVKFLSDADRDAFSLFDNKVAEMSTWDDDALKLQLEQLFNADYDISLTGFDLSDLDLGAVFSDEEPAILIPKAGAEPVSRLGDLWCNGSQRLLCGNAREVTSYEALLGDERATMVFCDPPYNVPIQGHVSGLGKVQHREFAEASGEMSPAEFTTWLRTIFRLCARFSISGSIHYHCMDWRHIREMLDAADGIYTDFKQLAVWVKGSGAMGSFYRSRHELVFIFKSGTEKHVNNFGLGEKGRSRTNVWEVDGANSFGKSRNQDLAAHPTCKPVALVADAMLDCSNRGDLILDPCGGSGTLLLAAHRTGRRGAAIEIDPIFVDVALRRLESVTGLVTTHADGRTFAEVAAARAAEETVDD